jgi:hypothetical protein
MLNGHGSYTRMLSDYGQTSFHQNIYEVGTSSLGKYRHVAPNLEYHPENKTVLQIASQAWFLRRETYLLLALLVE